jgi:hypothetical protein
MCLELKPIRIGMPCMPIPIRIRQNDADRTRHDLQVSVSMPNALRFGRSCAPEYEVYLLENGL